MPAFDGLRTYLRTICASGHVPGAVFRLSRDGEPLFFEAHGFSNVDTGRAMRTDALFRVKSMTKLVTTLAVLRTVEAGRLGLLEPLARYLPAFANPRVLRDDGQEVHYSTAGRPITIYDLMTHTSGMTYGQGHPIVTRHYKDAGLYFDIDFKTPLTAQELAARLATLPLAFEPGTRWAYSWGSDVLGAVLEIIHDAPLDTVFADTVLGPLGLESTSFRPGARAQDRLVQIPRHHKILTHEGDSGEQEDFLSGGEGLTSTAEDWGRLVDHVLSLRRNPGIISRHTAGYMLSDHIGRLRMEPGFPLQPAYSYAMGVYTRVQPGLSTAPAAVGEFGWWGSWGTAFWGDPANRIAGVLMMQRPDESREIIESVKFLSYSALDY
ncbi:serine hydrolase domain-containing protein [Nitrospirillum sp. BR 11163]|uniref:serine hydrolase domain-containing protein n=1 Tax=Nitrospirillum sp. BR 11163 TaxID=3104323 RepID=UPI002B000D73|nr:serine hydrolase domain-containing protein [Nitrospirillum sp. BR 11163]MEA1671948.1 serine hydrolase domain-containing protein [Nitrospirillum sp. BR 11163]